MVSETSVKNYNSDDTSDASNFGENSDAGHASYFRTINLRYFVAKPLEMLNEHIKFKELCLENGNPEAHYIEGLLQYFIHKERSTGLYHLRQSAIAKNSNGMYLYGLLMLAKGHYITGKRYLDKLQWNENLSLSDHCWKGIKNSLSAVPVRMRRQHYINMVNLEPRIDCHPDTMTEVCNNCYYYKRLNQFYRICTNSGRCTIIPSTTKITTRPPTMTHPPVPPSSPESPNTGESYDLSYLLDDPLDAVENYPELMEMCLRVNNPHANYIKGVHEYFGRNNVAQGLDHLKRSADGKCDVATYLYGLLMLSRGNMHEGRRYLSTLGWNTNMKRAEQCWTNVKKSLKRFHITMEDWYVENMFLLKPARRCHVNSFAKRCTRCFLYKQVMQFVDYI
ncbi:hypothetical protein IGI04_029780 [Brassica rapa subsp. trilocularis]|uniref:At2g35280-like TPR domain-containing protein n=1 Tax=Brassica rapa subsp. trilocularis TaxID=1813537 RepID=A0ABQ7LNX7_BRACM|nr:hypothetical protein IGI04_029780 [Brassica rapa subsp. trilocularis]